MNMSNEFRKAFFPTAEERLEQIEKFEEIHNQAVSEKWCSTCVHFTPPPDDLPGFVTDYGSCDQGKVVMPLESLCGLYCLDTEREKRIREYIKKEKSEVS